MIEEGGAPGDRLPTEAVLAEQLNVSRNALREAVRRLETVMVNRVWKWHFGEGIVRSVDNFGRLGVRDALRDGVTVEHTITAGEDEVDFRLTAHNPTKTPSPGRQTPAIRPDRSTRRPTSIATT